MVYCGKPSGGCERCRLRRIKCDQVRPACGQCTKQRKPCSGYRDTQAMLFRDQSSSVAKKYRSSSASRSDISYDEPSGSKLRKSSVSPTITRTATPIVSLTATPSQIAQTAIGFLLGTYVNGSHFAYLPDLYAESPSSSLLSDTIEMTALASFAQESSQPRVLELAHANYDRSLTRLASALRDPGCAVEDSTLASIQLLTLYEHLANDSGCAINHAWSKHALGALPILQLRGLNQFDTPISRALFKQAHDNVLLYCIQDRVRIPATLTTLQIPDQPTATPICDYDIEQPSWDFQPITIAFCDYYATRTQNPNNNPWTLISDALALDNLIETYTHSLPLSWAFQTVSPTDLPQTDPSLFHTSTAHIYPSHRIAQTWNTVRMMRATLHDNILTDITALEQSFHHPTLEPAFQVTPSPQLSSLRSASQILRKQQCEQICASVSQWLVTKEHRQSYSIAAGYFLVWPVFLAAVYEGDLCGEFAGRVLAWLGREMRIRSAGMAAEKLARGERWEGWLHVCHTF